jgi:enhancing lycopene biosynthesis protein 2
MRQTRNVLVESARIARGKIKPLSDFSSDMFDAIIFPGGFGVAKNLSSWAFDGAGCNVNADVSNAVRSMHRLHKPIGALCIAPVVIARILGGVTVTIGKDATTVKELETLGTRHQMAMQTQVVVDEKNMIFSTAMLHARCNNCGYSEGLRL